MTRAWLACCVAAAVASACRMPPTDRYEVGAAAVMQNDLLGALQAFDEVPVAHPRYPEARAAAADVERRMRRSHEILLEALLLRSEWRDQEALVSLQRARDVWPRLPGVDVLMRATENRLRLFVAHEAGNAVIAVAAPSPQPLPTPLAEVDLGRVDVREQGAVEVPAALAMDESVAPPVLPVMAVPDAEVVDIVAGRLVAVEGRLARGEFELAVVELFELAKYYPADLRVRLRLARVLHQRALLRYGQGALSGAISDWERLLQLEPGNAVAKSLLECARAELDGSATTEGQRGHR